MKAEAERLKAAFTVARAEVASHQQAREAHQIAVAAWDRTVQSLQQHEKEMASLEKELLSLHAEEVRHKELLPFKAVLETLERSLREHETLRINFVKKEALEKEQVQLRKEYVGWKEEIARLKDEIALLSALQSELAQARTALQKQDASIEQIDGRLTAIHGRIAANRSKIADLQERVRKITALGSDSPCPICTRPLLEQYDTVVRSLHEEIHSVYEKQIETAMDIMSPPKNTKTKTKSQLRQAKII